MHTGVEEVPAGMRGAARSPQPASGDSPALRASGDEALLRLIVDAAPLLIAYVDAEKRIQFANQTFLEFFGLGAAAVRGRPVAEVVGAEAAKVIGPYHAQALAGRRVSHESLIPFRGGRRQWMNVQLIPRVRDDGRTDGFLWLARDITPKHEIGRASCRESV